METLKHEWVYLSLNFDWPLRINFKTLVYKRILESQNL